MSRHTVKRRLLALALALCTVQPSPVSSATNADVPLPMSAQHYTSVDYMPLLVGTTTKGQPLINVTLNGKRSVVFLVDTGFATSTINAPIVKELGLSSEPATDNGQPFYVSGKQATMTTFSTMKLGRFTIKNQPFIVVPKQPSIPQSSLFDGVIGMNMLRYFAVLFDFDKHTIALLTPGRIRVEDLGQLSLPRPFVVPVQESNKSGYSFWYSEANFTNGGLAAKENFIVDTGSDTTVVSNQLAQQLHLQSLRQETCTTLGGSSLVDIANVEALHLGDVTALNSSVSFFDGSVKTEAPRLGLNILSGYRVLMDFPAGKMYLQPNPATVPAIRIGPAPATAPPPPSAAP